MLMKFSQLKSKDVRAGPLFEFIEDAKMIARGLQKLTSRHSWSPLPLVAQTILADTHTL